jgi:hypothetical protein
MLTDIFADRYLGIPMWDALSEVEERFLVQGFRIVIEQLFPYYRDGKEIAASKATWTSIHDKLSMELGLNELSPKAYHFQSTYNGKPVTHSGTWSMDKVCKDFVNAKYDRNISPDRFVKERLSFIELAFRERENQIDEMNKNLPQKLLEAQIQSERVKPGGRGIRIPGNREDGLKAFNESINRAFRESVDELNERMRRANFNLNYHNGFIQVSDDQLMEEQVERLFWEITKDPLWENVDIDMKEAVDLRDSNGRDPAFYAARALESTIKIISDQKGWTHGGEKGAQNYIENLGSKKNGAFISEWEREAIKAFFAAVRNPFGHGPGSEEMPKLTGRQTDWAIESCMSWIKSLVKRM